VINSPFGGLWIIGDTIYYAPMRYEASGTAYVYWEDQRGRWLCAHCRTQVNGSLRRHVGHWTYGREIPWCQVCREPFEIVEEPPTLSSDVRAWFQRLIGKFARTRS
jgi:hypothetical protein